MCGGCGAARHIRFVCVIQRPFETSRQSVFCLGSGPARSRSRNARSSDRWTSRAFPGVLEMCKNPTTESSDLAGEQMVSAVDVAPRGKGRVAWIDALRILGACSSSCITLGLTINA